MRLHDLFKAFLGGFKNFGEDIHAAVITGLLSIVYIIGIGIPSVIGKIFRKQFLQQKITSWKKVDDNEMDPYSQF